MTDKKLTDAEIKRALECCTQGRDIKVCWDCPLYVDLETARECCEKLNTNALDLIARQQAEIERLKALAENGASAIDTNNRLVQKFAEIKSEAVKEFAERLKEEYAQGINWFGVKEHYFVNVEDIDNLLKEMVGD